MYVLGSEPLLSYSFLVHYLQNHSSVLFLDTVASPPLHVRCEGSLIAEYSLPALCWQFNRHK